MNTNLRTILIGLLAVVLVGVLSLKGCNGPTPAPAPTPTPAPAPAPAPVPVGTGYVVSTFADGKLVQKVEASEYSANPDSTSLDYKLKSPDSAGTAAGHYDGTWVIQHNSWTSAPSTQRYNVTLYSGDKVVGTWKVHEFSTDSRSVLLYPGDGGYVLRVSGTVVIETIAGNAGGDPAEHVTVTEGDKVVYSKDLAWSRQIKYYLQGQPANGAGMIYIWGNAKVEPLKK